MNMSDELERLQSLHERGVLNAEEFARAKARLLGNPPASDDGAFNQLRRSRTDRVFSGVCGGLGQHSGMPSWGWRVMFCLGVIGFGFGFLIYFLLWLFMPLES